MEKTDNGKLNVNTFYDVLVIGGGAAGMAASLNAASSGKSVLLVEQGNRLGGVLLQCKHQGFGLGYFGENLTGIQYAERFEKKVKEAVAKGLPLTVLLGTTVTEFGKDRKAVLFLDNPVIIFGADKHDKAKIEQLHKSGQEQLHKDDCKKNGRMVVAFAEIILATGCREKSIHSLCVAGTRPAGIMTAGMAQKLMNVDGLDIGDDVVILGTGDIGQIVARDLVNSRKKVIAMIEKEASLGGLKRNQESCIRAFGIPVMLNTEIVRIFGKKRTEGIELYHKDTKTVEYLRCGLLLTAIGLIPDTDLLTESFGGKVPTWIRKLGNCDYVHDIVDTVTKEAESSH